MTGLNIPSIKNHLIERRGRLQENIKYVPDASKLYNLLQQVDAALERIDNGSYGLCEVCHDPVEPERLLADPLLTVCLDHLSHPQRKALEQDLELAIKIQRNLLPQNNLKANGWEICYHYSPAGTVSGDFCDLIKTNDDSLLFALGDVSGKGISASLMMSHLNALIRSLLSFNLPVNEIVTRSNRLFCESTMFTHYATMVFGKANQNGNIELCVAGHNPPLVIRKDEIISLNATGVPVGLFNQSEYELINFNMHSGDTLVLYTDGLTEASFNETEYGDERLKNQLIHSAEQSPQNIINKILTDQKQFLNNSSSFDDVTIMVIKKD
ncbi:MAG: SpoIIE family protein phosphatase [bacterium]|nr:SpoIIE family protein phosphatase [bacterium]